LAHTGDHIARIYNKLQPKLKRLSVLEKENESLREEIAELRKIRELFEKQLVSVQEQNYILKASASSLNDTEKAALEQTISRYIRDIDKCINLLSE
jgi:hypothetical protein